MTHHLLRSPKIILEPIIVNRKGKIVTENVDDFVQQVVLGSCQRVSRSAEIGTACEIVDVHTRILCRFLNGSMAMA